MRQHRATAVSTLTSDRYRAAKLVELCQCDKALDERDEREQPSHRMVGLTWVEKRLSAGRHLPLRCSKALACRQAPV